ncbi:MAG: prohibitin family protein [Bacteroidia bacterium]|nr:prohibitin family protein [Bacteroidia bacterium]
MKTFLKVVFLAMIPIFLSSCVIIRQGEVGVKRKFGKVNEVPLREGVSGFNPFSTVVIRVPTRTVNLEVKLPLPSKEGLTINSQISILYRVIPEKAPQLVYKVGLNYENELILPVFRSAVADVSARFMAKDMHSGARAAIESEIAERMNEILDGKGIIIDNVLMKSISLPPGLTRAIEEKLEAEQEAQRMVFVKQREQADAERRIIQAKGAKDSRIIEAEAEKATLELEAEGRANALKIEADAQAKANDMINKSLSEEVLRYRAIEAFINLAGSQNSKILITGSEMPFLGLPQELLDNK